MITDAELKKLIRDEINKRLNVILSGQAGENNQFSETIDNLFPGMPSITARPVMHPFGISSRAPKGTIAVTARQGANDGNRIILGHRDKDRPVVPEGAVILYDAYGQQIRVEDGTIKLGGEDSSEPMVLGNVLSDYLFALTAAVLDLSSSTSAIADTLSTVASICAGEFSPPASIALLAASSSATAESSAAVAAGSAAADAANDFVSSGDILSDESFVRKGQ